MAFHGLKLVCGQPGHSGLSSRPDRDRNEKAHCVQCSAESPAHSGCWEGPRGPGVPRLSPSPACPSTREGQDMGSGDRMEGELMRERGSPSTQGVASAELPHPVLPPVLSATCILGPVWKFIPQPLRLLLPPPRTPTPAPPAPSRHTPA